MFTVEGLLTFHGWAQGSYRVLFDHAATLPGEAFVKELEGFGFPSVRDQLAHLTECEDFWMSKVSGREFERWDYASFDDAAAIWAAYAPVAERTREFLSRLTPAQLLEPREVRFSRGGSERIAPGPILHHVITHGFHHKGQAVAMCRLLGYPAPETDLNLELGS